MGRYTRWGIVLSWAILVFVNRASSQSAGASADRCTQCSNNSAQEIFGSQFNEIREHANNNSLTLFFSPLTNGVSDCPTTFEEQVILLINIERSNDGKPPLMLDIRLQSPARWFSNDIAVNGYNPIDPHRDSNGDSLGDRITAAGYVWTALGETLNAGQGEFVDTPDKAVQGWMDSPGHRAILLSNAYEHIGVGHTNASVPPAVWENVFVADFGSTDDPRQGPPSSCDPGFFQSHFPFVTK